MSGSTPSRWIVVLDPERCTLCEVCARDCPTGALRLERTADAVKLLFDAALCHGCPEGNGCHETCPEGAIHLERGGGADGSERLLLASALIPCAHCGKGFAAVHELEVLQRAGRVHHELVSDLCPLCRREQLVVGFIERERVPGSIAEYRSTTDILRRAGKLRGEG